MSEDALGLDVDLEAVQAAIARGDMPDWLVRELPGFLEELQSHFLKIKDAR